MIVLRLLLNRGVRLWTTGLSRLRVGKQATQNPWATFPFNTRNRKQKSLIAISISRLGGKKLLFAVEHARLDQNDLLGEDHAVAIASREAGMLMLADPTARHAATG